jgi:tetrahydromethanopterin S-methyltransferase subunit G
MDGLKLPKGALDKEKMKDVVSRLAALEKKVAALEKAAEKKK